MPIVERYQVQFLNGPLADVARWVLPEFPQLLMGGSINGSADWDHLKKTYGITHALNLETEHDETSIVGDCGLHIPVPDDGQPKNPAWFAVGLYFTSKVLSQPHQKLYLHCQAGGSRTPTMLYAILRKRFSLPPKEALTLIRAEKPGYGNHAFHVNYIASAEVALLGLPEL